jgi:signal transduction histidine kinase
MRPVDPRLEQLLGTGTAAFRAAFDLIPDPVSVLWAIRGTDGAVADLETGYTNPAMDRMIGVSMEASFGRRLLGESPGFAADDAYQMMRGVIETGVPAVEEVTVESSDGPIGRMAGVFTHRAIPFGPDALMNLVTDITAQRRLETELERYAKVAAHDLREPLLAMTLFVEQLARGLDDGTSERNLRIVAQLRQTSTRARTLVDGILEYARHGTDVAFEPVDMDAVAAEVLGSLASALDGADASVVVGGLPTVRGSRAQLGRVVQNLVANSLKFRAAAPPQIRIAAERADGFWLFSVTDNGVGIPPELGDEAFAMFKRAHGEETEGSGIGLAVCRKVVEAHGGAITAAPGTGGGTVVSFSIPAEVPAVASAG